MKLLTVEARVQETARMVKSVWFTNACWLGWFLFSGNRKFLLMPFSFGVEFTNNLATLIKKTSLRIFNSYTCLKLKSLRYCL